MTVTWAKGYEPQQIIKQIEESRKVDQSGKVTFEGFTHHIGTILLYDHLVFSNPIPEVEGRGIVTQATFNVGGKGIITVRTLLAEINKLTNNYLKRSPEPFVLATSLSLDRFMTLPPMRINGATIRFDHHLPKHFNEEQKKITERAKDILLADLPTNYLSARVRVSARSIYEAFDTASEALDLVRGIWNWFYNMKHFTRMSFGSRSQVNKIVIGPVHTLHKPSGELASEIFWYEPSYRAPIQAHDLRQDSDQIRRFYESTQKRLKSSHYRSDLEEAIVRYTRALDERDLHIAFLKLWSILEILTFTSRDSYDVTIRRTAYLFEDRDYQMQVLKVLRDHRNQAVHASLNTQEIETYLYELKNCIEALLRFHLGNKYRFTSLQDAAVFLDLPAEKDALNAKAKLIGYAQKFRGHK